MRRHLPIVVITLAVVAMLLSWARLHPAAPDTLAQAGFGQALTRLLTGAEPSPAGGELQGNGQANAASSGQSPAAGKGSGGSGGAPGGKGPPTPRVVVEAVSTNTINDRVQAIGTGSAVASATVQPLSAGILTRVSATSGATVEKGDALAQLDRDEEQIARDRAKRTLDDARRDRERIESLFGSQTSTQVEVDAAMTNFDDARLALRQAELFLTRRTVKAPIAGTIDIVRVKPGNHVTTTTTIATIDDRSEITVDFWVPERFAGAVKLGQRVNAKAFALPGRALVGEISAIGSRVEADSRTLPLQATIINDNDRLRPGMSFELTLRFDGETWPAIDPLAVQWDSEGSFAWQVVNGTAKRTALRIVQRNPRSVLIDSTLSERDEVITEGVLSVRDGAPVEVVGGRQAITDGAEEVTDQNPGAGRNG